MEGGLNPWISREVPRLKFLFFTKIELDLFTLIFGVSQVMLVVKNPPASAGDVRDSGSIPGSGRSLKEVMATHSSLLAWRIPWTEEPGRLQSMGLQTVRHD